MEGERRDEGHLDWTRKRDREKVSFVTVGECGRSRLMARRSGAGKCGHGSILSEKMWLKRVL